MVNISSNYTVEEVFEFLRKLQVVEREEAVNYLRFSYGIDFKDLCMRIEGENAFVRGFTDTKTYDLQYKKEGQGWRLAYSSAKRFWLKSKRCHAYVVPGLLFRKRHAYRKYEPLYLPVAKYVVPLETLFEGIMVEAPNGRIFVKEYSSGQWSMRQSDEFGFFKPLPVLREYNSFLAAIDLSAWPDQAEAASLYMEYQKGFTAE